MRRKGVKLVAVIILLAFLVTSVISVGYSIFGGR